MNYRSLKRLHYNLCKQLYVEKNLKTFDHIKEDVKGEKHDSFGLSGFEHVRDAGHNAAFERSVPVQTSLTTFRRLAVLDFD